MNKEDHLSPSQREAVMHYTGPCEVIAGPGSGKTAVLTKRISFLIEDRHVDPSSILVLTFSKAAALEMQSRFMKGSGGAYPSVSFGTFHSVFYTILKLSSQRPVRLVDGAVRRQFLKALLVSFYRDPSARPDVSDVESEISRYKNSCSSGKTFSVSGSFREPRIFPEIVRRYDMFLSENGYTDFDGMLTGCLTLLKEREDVLKKWRERFRFLLVDEFQDINPVQYEAVRLLAGRKKNLFVVGDDDQSIYGFRGSDPSIMRNFRQDYPDANVVFLSENYRCSGAVAHCAGLVISENRIRIGKTIRAVRPRGKAVHIRSFETEAQENRTLCRIFSRMDAGQRSDCAVIYRTHRQSMGLVREMDRMGIPYAGSGRAHIREEREVLEDIRAYFRAAYAFCGEGAAREDLCRIMNRPQRFFPRDICTKERIRPQDLLHEAKRRPGIREGLIRFTGDLKLLSEIRPGYAMRYLMYAMGYEEGAIRGRKECEGEIRALIQDLVSKSAELPGRKELADMLENRLEGLRGSLEKDSNGESSRGGIRIMTMHACKGLQFRYVFLPDLNEGVIPSRRADSGEALEEERRLFYVAITRAKEELSLLYIGGTAENRRRPTRFLRVLGVRAYT